MTLRAAALALLLLVPSAALALVLVVPAAASAETAIARPLGHPAECARLHRQIAHFEGMAARAEQLQNELWVERTEQQVERLRERQQQRCPGDVPDDGAKEAFLAFMALLKLAGQAALTYFTFGAL